MVSVLLAVLCQAPAESPPAVWVALARRQGVAATTANAQLADVVKQLTAKGVPVAPEPGDVTTCQHKLACIVAAARKRGADWVVLVETGRVLEQAIVKVDLISIEEDGRKVGSGVYDGPAAGTTAGLTAQVESAVLPGLAALVPAPAVVVAPEPALAPAVEPQPVAEPAAVVEPPAVAAPEPQPVAARVDVDAAVAPRPIAWVRWLPGAFGLVAGGVGVGLFVKTKSDAASITSHGFTGDVASTVATDRTLQPLGVALMAVGVAAIVVSVVWLMLAPDDARGSP